jgi:hypothetical protein
MARSGPPSSGRSDRTARRAAQQLDQATCHRAIRATRSRNHRAGLRPRQRPPRRQRRVSDVRVWVPARWPLCEACTLSIAVANAVPDIGDGERAGAQRPLGPAAQRGPERRPAAGRAKPLRRAAVAGREGTLAPQAGVIASASVSRCTASQLRDARQAVKGYVCVWLRAMPRG